MKETVATLITGASEGIGYDLSYLFAENGYNLVLVARNEKKLELLAHVLENQYQVSVKTIAKDLTQVNATQDIFDILQQEKIVIEILVNNAGCGTFGNFYQTRLSDQLQMIQLNITALTQFTHLFLDSMLHRKKGKILNVASVASFAPGPQMAVYYASKAFVLSFSEALMKELQNHGITVTALCPGSTQTKFHNKAGMKSPQDSSKKLLLMDSFPVAKAGFDGLMAGKRLIITGKLNKLFIFLLRGMPRWLPPYLINELQKRAGQKDS